MTGLRLASAMIAVAGAALVVWQKHLITRPGPGLVLVAACFLPFLADARWPRLLRPSWPAQSAWPLITVMLVVAACAGALLGYRPAEGDAAVIFLVAVAATIAAAARSATSIAAGVLVVLIPAIVGWLAGSHTPAAALIGIAFAWVAGTAVRVQDRTAEEVNKLRSAAVEHQIAEERQQLAREFHDLVAHTMSVTMLHMTAVRMSLEDGDQREALESLDQAQSAGREAMREMRQTVRLLGSSSSASQPMPLPHVRDVPDLVSGYVTAGLNVTLDTDGDLGAVSGDVGLAAYRIAQESLANVAKHAPESTARLQLRVSAAELRLIIMNDIVTGAVPAPAATGPGHGVDGMAQRAALVGGTLSAGPAGGRWRVEAVLPIGERR
jgi:signal transduction histidine kinase